MQDMEDIEVSPSQSQPTTAFDIESASGIMPLKQQGTAEASKWVPGFPGATFVVFG